VRRHLLITLCWALAGACGDQLFAGDAAALRDGAELLGWAASAPADATAALTDVLDADGCTHHYVTDDDELAAQVAAGGRVIGALGFVWPPGWGDAAPPADPVDADSTLTPLAAQAPAPCTLGKNPAVILFYSGFGEPITDRFLQGCPGEVIVGEKHERGPSSRFASATYHAAGGRTGFIIDANGHKLIALLLRPNGVERTAAYVRGKLAAGYDYVVFDEITMDSNFMDTSTAGKRLRQLMLRVPRHSIIPYISLDLTQGPIGAIGMANRKWLLRSFRLYARAMALENYLHTDAVMAGAAPSTFRTGIDRVANAMRGMQGGSDVARHAFTTLGLSMHQGLSQYNYLDDPRHDLAALSREVNAIRHGSARLRQEHGLGFYMVGSYDVQPRPGAPYTYTQLVAHLRSLADRFR